MNRSLEKLTSDLQEITRMESEVDTLEASTNQKIAVRPYSPSDAVNKFDTEQTEHNRWAKNVFFGEIR